MATIMNEVLRLGSTSTSKTGITTMLVSLILLCVSLFLSKNRNKKKFVPEVAGAWPILGHFRLFGVSEPFHIVLKNMAAKYGPIFSLRLGVHRTVIINSRDIAKELYTTHDRTFANRPNILATEILGYNNAMFALNRYLPYWREIRKMSMIELLSNARLQALRHVRLVEVTTAIKKTYELCKNKGNDEKVCVDVRNWVHEIVTNIILGMVVGKRVEDARGSNEQWAVEMGKFLSYISRIVPSDGIPFLRWLDLGGHVKEMKRIHKELDCVLNQWLKEHKQRRILGKTTEEQDFMDVMISVFSDSKEIHGIDVDTVVKANCLGLIAGGVESATTSTAWTIALLLNNLDVLKKAQHEIDTHVGREKQVQESDLEKLVYLQAVIKEAFRLNPIVTPPHETLEDCVVNGYHIPAGTKVMVNRFMLHRDPTVWSDPDEFQPERFLTSHKEIDVKGQNFELLPFGAGRRICPGISLALQVMLLTLASFLHSFDITAENISAISMKEGLHDLNNNPFNVLLTPRLSAHWYQ